LSAGCNVASFEVALFGQTAADHHAIRTALNRVQEIQRIDAPGAWYFNQVDVFGQLRVDPFLVSWCEKAPLTLKQDYFGVSLMRIPFLC